MCSATFVTLTTLSLKLNELDLNDQSMIKPGNKPFIMQHAEALCKAERIKKKNPQGQEFTQSTGKCVHPSNTSQFIKRHS